MGILDNLTKYVRDELIDLIGNRVNRDSIDDMSYNVAYTFLENLDVEIDDIAYNYDEHDFIEEEE